jgi:hypothetical protein
MLLYRRKPVSSDVKALHKAEVAGFRVIRLRRTGMTT